MPIFIDPSTLGQEAVDDLEEMAMLVGQLEEKVDTLPKGSPELFRLPNRPHHRGRVLSEDRSFRRFDTLHEDLSGLRILNVSCGVGREAHRLLERGASEVHLLDLSEPAVHHVARYLPAAYPDRRFGFTVASAQNLPYPDDAFDMVLVYASAHHYPDFAGFLAEATRVAAELVVLSEPAVMGLAQGILDRAGWNTEYGELPTARFDERQVVRLCRELGLSCTTQRLSTYFPRALDRWGESTLVTGSWFLLLGILDTLSPRSLRHSLGFYAKRAKSEP